MTSQHKPAVLEEWAHDQPFIQRSLGTAQRRVNEAEPRKLSEFHRRTLLGDDLAVERVLTLANRNFKPPGTGIHPDD